MHEPTSQRPTVDLLIWAYRSGVFPMADPDSGVIEWFSPDPRGILPLDEFHVSRNLERRVRQQGFRIASDEAFETVMRHCAADRADEGGTWIDEQLIEAFVAMHRAGFAHSVEAWTGDGLVGGLYGVHIGGAFFGESMFILPDRGGRDSSKVCLVHLVRWMQRRGCTLLDTQFWNPHLHQFGCVEISRDEYLRRLEQAIALPIEWDFRA